MNGRQRTDGRRREKRKEKYNNNERRRRFKNNIYFSFTVFHTDGREFSNIILLLCI